jgi:hypothetical protein
LPSDKPVRRLEDIIEGARAAMRYVAGLDLAAFEEDRKTCDAVERCLERISEAGAKLGDLAPVSEVSLPLHHCRGSEKPFAVDGDCYRNFGFTILAPSLAPGQLSEGIRALGNRLRHEYDAIRGKRPRGADLAGIDQAGSLRQYFGWLRALLQGWSRQTAVEDDRCPDEKKNNGCEDEEPFPVLRRVAKDAGETSSVPVGDERYGAIAEGAA